MKVICPIVIGTLCVFGCGGMYYTYDGKRFENLDQVGVAMEAIIAARIEDVVPLPKPVTTKSLIFAAPNYSAIMAATERMDSLRGVKRNAVQQGDAKIKAQEAEVNMRLTAGQITKRNIYQKVDVKLMPEFSFAPPSATDTEDVYYLACSYSADGTESACQPYYISTAYGRQIFAWDKSSPIFKERSAALLDALAALAMRE